MKDEGILVFINDEGQRKIRQRREEGGLSRKNEASRGIMRPVEEGKMWSRSEAKMQSKEEKRMSDPLSSYIGIMIRRRDV